MNEDVSTVHITKAMTSSMIVDMMEEYPNLEVITCSPSVYNRTSSTYIDALSQLDIEVVKKYNWGAKSRTNGVELEVKNLSDSGLKPKEIAEKLDITLNRVYYLLKKSNARFNNRKRKNNHELIRQLRNEGLKPKEIAEKLDTPLRSVYYVLNKK